MSGTVLKIGLVCVLVAGTSGLVAWGAGAFYLACGYQPAGRRAVRVDRLDRAASVVARLSRTGPFVPPRELPSILGCPDTEVPAVLSGIGYVERDGRFEWHRRGRREARRRA